MLYETLNHQNLLLIFSFVGFFSGFVFDLFNYLKFLFANKKFFTIFFDVLSTIICCFVLYFTNIKINYGQIRFFPIIIFATSFALQRITIGKLFAKIHKKCYNKLNKIKNKLFRNNNHEK